MDVNCNMLAEAYTHKVLYGEEMKITHLYRMQKTAWFWTQTESGHFCKGETIGYFKIPFSFIS